MAMCAVPDLRAAASTLVMAPVIGGGAVHGDCDGGGEGTAGADDGGDEVGGMV